MVVFNKSHRHWSYDFRLDGHARNFPSRTFQEVALHIFRPLEADTETSVLQTSKSFNYIGYQHISEVSFAVLLLTWT